MIEPMPDSADTFDEEAFMAWLANPRAPRIRDEVRPPAAGFRAFERAVVVADSHMTCSKDLDRQFNVILGVTGSDMVNTIHTVRPGTNVNCVVKALREDPEVKKIQHLRNEPIEDVTGG